MRKKIIFSLLGLAIITFGLIMLWPLSLTDAITDGAEMQIIVVDLGASENGQFDTTSTSYVFQPGSEEYIQIRQILDKYSIHRSFRSFFKETSISGRNGADYNLQIYFVENGNLSKSINTLGTGEIAVNDRVYRIGYWGNKKALAMMDEIRSILEQSIPSIKLRDFGKIKIGDSIDYVHDTLGVPIGYLWGKMNGPHDEMYSLEDGSNAIIYFDVGGIVSKIIVEPIVEISKKYLETEESQEVIATITNYDTPIIEVTDFENKVAWKVKYTTTLDGLLGPITIYVDGYTGDILGTGLRF